MAPTRVSYCTGVPVNPGNMLNSGAVKMHQIDLNPLWYEPWFIDAAGNHVPGQIAKVGNARMVAGDEWLVFGTDRLPLTWEYINWATGEPATYPNLPVNAIGLALVNPDAKVVMADHSIKLASQIAVGDKILQSFTDPTMNDADLTSDSVVEVFRQPKRPYPIEQWLRPIPLDPAVNRLCLRGLVIKIA